MAHYRWPDVQANLSFKIYFSIFIYVREINMVGLTVVQNILPIYVGRSFMTVRMYNEVSKVYTNGGAAYGGETDFQT